MTSRKSSEKWKAGCWFHVAPRLFTRFDSVSPSNPSRRITRIFSHYFCSYLSRFPLDLPDCLIQRIGGTRDDVVDLVHQHSPNLCWVREVLVIDIDSLCPVVVGEKRFPCSPGSGSAQNERNKRRLQLALTTMPLLTVHISVTIHYFIVSRRFSRV